MKEIQKKIQELLAFNDIEPIYDFTQRGSDNPNTMDNIMKRQEEIQGELDDLAKGNNTILGRGIKFPMADSYAFYVVTKVNKKTVEVTSVRYCDAWQDERLGYCGNLKRGFAEKKIKGMDAIAEMFSAKKAQQV